MLLIGEDYSKIGLNTEHIGILKTFLMIPCHSYPSTSLKRRLRGSSAERSPKDLPFLGAGEEWLLQHTKKTFQFFSCFFDFFLTFLIFLRHFWTFWKNLFFPKHSRFFIKNRKFFAHYSQQILMIPIMKKDEKTIPLGLNPLRTGP